LKQVQDDRTTVYVVTRPPKSDSPHEQAVRRWEESKRANVVFLKDLHTKLYIAQLRGGAFALMGSANFTTPSLTRYQELGMLIDERGRDGTRIVKELKAEAARLYRKDGRQRFCQARL
jgi:phosphatidylserine/phosphatidylglycerophosphate/cardiolipin synthase-like enzyme